MADSAGLVKDSKAYLGWFPDPPEPIPSTRDYEKEWHEEKKARRRTITRARAREWTYVGSLAKMDPMELVSEGTARRDLRAAYYDLAVLKFFPGETHKKQRQQWRDIWSLRDRLGSPADPEKTKSVMRRVYYLLERYPDLVQEFALYVPYDMPFPRGYHGPRFDIMNPRADAVRPKIWKYLLQSTEEIFPQGVDAAQKRFFLGPDTLYLLRLNKKSSEETARIFYRENAFLFSTTGHQRYTAFCDFMRNRTPRQLRHLRRIHLEIDSSNYDEATDYWLAAALAFFTGNHHPNAGEPVFPPRARLKELKITIVGDVVFTRDDYAWVVRSAPKFNGKGKLRRTVLASTQGETVLINDKLLCPGKRFSRLEPVEGLEDITPKRWSYPLTIDGVSDEILVGRQKLVYNALVHITGYERLVVKGLMDTPLRKAIRESKRSRNVADVVQGGKTLRSFRPSFSLDDMVRINWPLSSARDASHDSSSSTTDKQGPGARRVVLGILGTGGVERGRGVTRMKDDGQDPSISTIGPQQETIPSKSTSVQASGSGLGRPADQQDGKGPSSLSSQASGIDRTESTTKPSVSEPRTRMEDSTPGSESHHKHPASRPDEDRDGPRSSASRSIPGRDDKDAADSNRQETRPPNIILTRASQTLLDPTSSEEDQDENLLRPPRKGPRLFSGILSLNAKTPGGSKKMPPGSPGPQASASSFDGPPRNPGPQAPASIFDGPSSWAMLKKAGKGDSTAYRPTDLFGKDGDATGQVESQVSKEQEQPIPSLSKSTTHNADDRSGGQTKYPRIFSSPKGAAQSLNGTFSKASALSPEQAWGLSGQADPTEGINGIDLGFARRGQEAESSNNRQLQSPISKQPLSYHDQIEEMVVDQAHVTVYDESFLKTGYPSQPREGPKLPTEPRQTEQGLGSPVYVDVYDDSFARGESSTFPRRVKLPNKARTPPSALAQIGDHGVGRSQLPGPSSGYQWTLASRGDPTNGPINLELESPDYPPPPKRHPWNRFGRSEDARDKTIRPPPPTREDTPTIFGQVYARDQAQTLPATAKYNETTPSFFSGGEGFVRETSPAFGQPEDNNNQANKYPQPSPSRKRDAATMSNDKGRAPGNIPMGARYHGNGGIQIPAPGSDDDGGKRERKRQRREEREKREREGAIRQNKPTQQQQQQQQQQQKPRKPRQDAPTTAVSTAYDDEGGMFRLGCIVC